MIKFTFWRENPWTDVRETLLGSRGCGDQLFYLISARQWMIKHAILWVVF
jgi:hypothetical protein